MMQTFCYTTSIWHHDTTCKVSMPPYYQPVEHICIFFVFFPIIDFIFSINCKMTSHHPKVFHLTFTVVFHHEEM